MRALEILHYLETGKQVGLQQIWSPCATNFGLHAPSNVGLSLRRCQ